LLFPDRQPLSALCRPVLALKLLKIGFGGLYQLGQSFNCTAIIQQNSLLSRISIMSEILQKTWFFYHAGKI
jgi:hypothetical protein